MCYFSTRQSIYLSCLPAYLPACLPACLPAGRPVGLPACLFDLLIRPVYSNCLFNPPIQPISYNKYARRCYFSTYQSSIYPAFLSNLPVQSAYSICLLNLPTQSAYSICLLNLPVQSACPICLLNLPINLLTQSAYQSAYQFAYSICRLNLPTQSV